MADYLNKKEYRNLKNYQHVKSKTWITPNKLELAAYQFLAQRRLNIYGKTNRLLCKLGTGLGKTLTSLMAALAFINVYHVINQKIGKKYNCHIIGFSKNVFRNEFLKFPELGIITYSELHKLNSLRELRNTSTGSIKEKITDEYKKFKIKILRRITDESSGGLYNFIGYRELFNNLFNNTDMPEDVDESNIFRYYVEGKISVNKFLLESFENSFIILDEIHLAYNSEDTNNYGLAIQFLLDFYGDKIKALFLSATILNRSMREIISIANMMRDTGSPHFKSADYFTEADKGKPYDTMRLKPIYKQFEGKVIFLEESGTDYPTLIIEGKKYKDLPYLQFDLCEMSPLHEQTFVLDDLYNNKSNRFIINDMVFPNPDYSPEAHKYFHPSIFNKAKQNKYFDMKGLYDTEDMFTKIENAPAEWRQKIGISIKEKNGVKYFTGSFLHRDNVGIYYAKGAHLLDTIHSIRKSDPKCKMLIYHPFVRGSGIMNIGELLNVNGFTPYGELPKPDSLSYEANLTREEWAKKHPDKEFKASNYFVFDFSVNENKKFEIVDVWNSFGNRYGEEIQIFIAANKIKQSIDLKDTTILIIMARPDSIPTYIQIKGRAVRKLSTANLPPEKRSVHLYTFLSVGNSPTKLSIEARKYKRKLIEFDNIRNIEYHINKSAINNYMFDEFKSVDVLGALPYKNDNSKLPKKIDDSSFYYYGYYNDTFNKILNQIKIAFISIPVWTYKKLYDFVLTYTNTIDISTDKNLFNYALKKIIYNPNNIIDNKNIVVFNNENNIFDIEYFDGTENKTDKRVIIERGKYFILTLINDQYEIVEKQDIFLHNKKLKKVKYTINIDDQKFIDKKLDKLLQQISAYKPEKMANYAYIFLFQWEENYHYRLMSSYLLGKRKNIPHELISMYKKLNIMGNNWYEDKNIRYILEGKGFTQKDKANNIKVNNKEILGLIQNSSFKLKSNTDEDDSNNDKRAEQRGMNCLNVNKDKLQYYLDVLGIKSVKSKVKLTCIEIVKKLIDKEINAIKNGENIKYVYLFNERF